MKEPFDARILRTLETQVGAAMPPALWDMFRLYSGMCTRPLAGPIIEVDDDTVQFAGVLTCGRIDFKGADDLSLAVNSAPSQRDQLLHELAIDDEAEAEAHRLIPLFVPFGSTTGGDIVGWIAGDDDVHVILSGSGSLVPERSSTPIDRLAEEVAKALSDRDHGERA